MLDAQLQLNDYVVSRSKKIVSEKATYFSNLYY
jgi:hypothetical protein